MTFAKKQNVLIYTVHKAASRFLTRLMYRVTRNLQMEYHSPSNDDDYGAILNGSWRDFIEQGDRRGCFGPIRFGTFEPTVPADVRNYSIIAHLRDPRDVLTSLYYSHVYSHGSRRFHASNAERQTWHKHGIDRFVLDRASLFRERYEVFCSELFGKEGVRFLKYETLVTDYAAWLAQFLEGFAGWVVPKHPARRFWQRLWNGQPHLPALSRLHSRLYAMFKGEFAVSTEDVRRHRRQVTPGDHRRKLRTTTIDKLNSEFRDILNRLGYALTLPGQTRPKRSAA